jgi:hypothetical protein
MITKIVKCAALVIAALLAGVPAFSYAATTQASIPVHATYETSIQSIYGFDAPWTGMLQLTFNPDGIIQGYYRPADNMAFVPVTGGRNGDSVWLDIGRSGHLHVNGVLQNGVITGSAVDESTQHPYTFSARVSS